MLRTFATSQQLKNVTLRHQTRLFSAASAALVRNFNINKKERILLFIFQLKVHFF